MSKRKQKQRKWRVVHKWDDEFDFSRLWLVQYEAGWWILKWWKTKYKYYKREDAIVTLKKLIRE